jgi:hypothetical protein
MVREVCGATCQDAVYTANQYREKWNMLKCVRYADGNPVRIKCPMETETGSNSTTSSLQEMPNIHKLEHMASKATQEPLILPLNTLYYNLTTSICQMKNLFQV